MRILHISTRLILGGSQENTVLSCEGQLARGHEVHLAFGPIYGPEGSMLERVRAFRAPPDPRAPTEPRTIGVHEVPTLVRQIDPLKDHRAYRDLRRLINTLKPDVVHTHSSKAGIVGRAAAWDARPRPAIVHTIHGPPFMPVEGGMLKRLKIRTLNYEYTLAERFAAKQCHVIVSVADAMTEQFRARNIGRPEQFMTVRSGIPIEPYLHASPGEDRASVRTRLGLSASDFVVGTVARLAQHKGHDDLLDALGAALVQRPKLKLLWVGDGWWREKLCARARHMGLKIRELDKLSGSEHNAAPSGAHRASAQIVLTGLVPPEAIPGLVRAMDVLAHPSVREGLPRTVPQALLAGVCPVAYDADGTREACIDNVTGRLVRVGDVPGLGAAVLGLMDDPAARARLAQAGREMCVREFSVNAMLDGLETAYARALGGAGAEAAGRSSLKRG